MRFRLNFGIWLVLFIAPVFVLWAVLVLLMIGSFDGVRTIDTVDVHFDVVCEAQPDAQRSCTMAYSYGGQRFSFNDSSSPMIPLDDVHENPWEALIELPSSFFDRRICAELSGKNAGSSVVRLQLDAEKPALSTLAVNGRICTLLIEDGERRFSISRPQLSSIDFDPVFRKRAIDVLQTAILNPQAPTVATDDLDLRVMLSSELVQSDAIKVIHAVAFVLALHITVLLYELYSMARASWLRRCSSRKQ